MRARIFQALLALFPRAFRARFGDELLDTAGTLDRARPVRLYQAPLVVLDAMLTLLSVRREMRLEAARPIPSGGSMPASFVERADLRSAVLQTLRSLRARPAFAFVSLLTLAFGIGTTTAVFSVVNRIVIQPLPYPEADRLVAVYETNPATHENVSLIAPVRLADWKQRSTAFTALSGSYTENVTDTSAAEPERLAGRDVMPDYFAVFGTAPFVGRTFTADEERFGGPRAAVISEGFWTRRFARDPGVVGKRLVIGGAGYTIVGVMPNAFAPPGGVDVWLPAQLNPAIAGQREARFLSGVGRMKPGVTIAQAADDLARVQHALGDEYPSTDRGWSATAQDLKALRIGDYTDTLWLVFAAVGFLLLIVIANVACLMLVQLNRRSRELAIRTAIGASRARVVGAVMREVVVLSVVGAAGGAVLARWIIGVLKTSFAALPRMAEVALDWRALAFATLASVLAAIVFGLAPALYATRGRLALAASGARGVAGGQHRLQKTLVVAQIALSLPLAASAGLVLRSYDNLTRVDLGFQPEGVVTFHVGAGWSENRGQIGQMQLQLVEELRRIPGVAAAGFANFLPATGATLRYQVSVQGLAGPDAGGLMTAGERTVTRGFLQALGVPLVAGQWCAMPRADLTAPWDALVNRRFVERFAGGQPIIGRELRFSQDPAGPGHRIVGVVGDAAEDGPGTPNVPYVYACMPPGSWPDPEYVVKTTDAAAVVPAIRQVVHRLAPTRAVFGVQTLDDVLASALEQPRMNSRLLGLFAGAAVALASLGLYSLFMLLVAERTRELGVRMALGAAPREMVRLVCAGAARLVIVGTVAGLAMALASARALRALLYGVSPVDAATLAGTVLTLALVSLAAIALPALRAARVDPIEAMRTE